MHPSSIALPDVRDQVLVERRREIVHRREAPITSRGAVVHILRPRIDDALAFLIGGPLHGRTRERSHDRIVDLLRSWTESREVVGGARQTLAWRFRQIEQR